MQLNNDNQGAELKKYAAEIGALMKQGKKEEAEEAKAKVAALKEEQKTIAEKLDATEIEMRDILLSIPNIPCDMVPEGRTAEDNVVEKQVVKCRHLAKMLFLIGIWQRNITL